MQEHPNYQDIVLIGGGHAHALVLQMWAMNPLPGARLTLVSPQVYTPYSGMLPGMVAGHYNFRESHIDLPHLCRAAGARFIQACAHHIDVHQNQVSLLGRPPLDFDLLSLDIGATPSRDIPGAELAIPIKPIGNFHRYWQQLQQQIVKTRTAVKLGVVGGGVGGCELAMAMAAALEEPMYSGRVEIHLLHANGKLPNGYPLLARRLLARELHRLKIQVHRNWPVAEITPRGVHSDHGDFLALDKVALCTQAAAPPWLAESGLELDEHGFVLVDADLRAHNQSNIFAAGDVASLSYQPVPKAGVFAVRQGPILFHNLRAALLNKPLRHYRPQKDFLSLMSCGNQRALAVRNGVAVVGNSLWLWKDHIDRNFMRRFSELPVGMPASRKHPWQRLRKNEQLNQRDGISMSGMRCNGCGAKVGADVLHQALQQLPPQQSSHLLRGAGDDAAVMQLPAGKLLVQSSDQLRAPVADPWLFGRLSALHALSDLFAMHAQPITAQALVTLPLAAAEVSRRDLQQLLDGAVRELNLHNCALSGGHTSEGSELQLGLTVNGIADKNQLLNKTGARAGDCLILSKALGVGTLFAAEGQGKAKARWLQQALESMLHSNATAAEIFASSNANALTDVTGFGLLGHLLEMLNWNHADKARQTALGATLFAESLPLLPGATTCAEQGWLSSLHTQNSTAYTALQNPAVWQNLPHWQLLVDPQTCGGLLAAVPADQAEDCVRALRAAGNRQAEVIGVLDTLPANTDALELYQPVHLAISGDWKKMARRNTEMIS